MAKGNVPKSFDREKERDVMRELFKQFENLPAEVRNLLIAHSSSHDVLLHVASGIQDTLDELRGNASADELRQESHRRRAGGVRAVQEHRDRRPNDRSHR